MTRHNWDMVRRKRNQESVDPLGREALDNWLLAGGGRTSLAKLEKQDQKIRKKLRKERNAVLVTCPLCDVQMPTGALWKHIRKTHGIRDQQHLQDTLHRKKHTG